MSDEKKTSGTVILRCTCRHPFQDSRYGKGMRVHNLMGAGKASSTRRQCRCTGCGTVR